MKQINEYIINNIDLYLSDVNINEGLFDENFLKSCSKIYDDFVYEINLREYTDVIHSVANKISLYLENKHIINISSDIIYFTIINLIIQKKIKYIMFFMGLARAAWMFYNYKRGYKSDKDDKQLSYDKQDIINWIHSGDCEELINVLYDILCPIIVKIINMKKPK